MFKGNHLLVDFMLASLLTLTLDGLFTTICLVDYTTVSVTFSVLFLDF